MARLLDIPSPEKPNVIEQDGNRSVIEIAGLYPGYGVTLGNALRRTLLSSLPGAAATMVTFKGVSHEFATVPGVQENVLDIALNLKRLRMKHFADEPQRLVLNAKGEGAVTAKDLEAPSQVQVTSTDLHIATLTSKKAALEFEVTVERGIGYETVEERKQEKMPVGSIALDAIYTPVQEVNFTVENMRVGDRTDYNRLRLDIETDGTMDAEEALARASDILIGQFGVLIPKDFVTRDTEAGGSGILAEPLAILGLTGGVVSNLEEGGVRTVGDLVAKTEKDLDAIKGLGAKAVKDISKALKDHDLALAPEEK